MKAIDIRKRRKELGLSQTDLGNMIGVSTNTIYNYEKGLPIPESSYKMLSKVLFGSDAEQDNKQIRVDNKLNEIYEATNELIAVIDDQIAETQRDVSTIQSIERIQSLLRIKLELISELQQSKIIL